MKSLKLTVLILFCLTILNISWASLSRNNSDTDFSKRIYRIVGGVDVNIPHDFMVSIKISNIHKCGGSILNEFTVLTAAHCIDMIIPAISNIHVGDKTLTVMNGKSYEIQDMIRHPKYDPITDENDMGLIRVQVPFSKIKPIQLSRSESVFTTENNWATVFGWGFIHADGPTSDILQIGYVLILSDAICRASYPNRIMSSMFCAGYTKGGVDACLYDSGGPLIFEGKQVGIVSWGDGCALQDRPGVYANVPRLRPWVDSVLEKYGETIP